MAGAAAALTALRSARSQLETGLAAEKESAAQLQKCTAQMTARCRISIPSHRPPSPHHHHLQHSHTHTRSRTCVRAHSCQSCKPMATALSRFDLLGHARHLLYNYSQVTIMYGRSPKRFAGLCQKKPLLILGFLSGMCH